MSLIRRTSPYPPLSPPWARPLRSGRALAVILSIAVAASGLAAAILLATGMGPRGDSLLITRAAALAMAVAALAAAVAAGGLARPAGARIADGSPRPGRFSRGQGGRLGRDSWRRAGRGRDDRILEAVARIGGEGDADAVLAATASAVVAVLGNRAASPVIARVYRIERDTMVAAGERGAAAGTTVGDSHPLSADPLIMAAVNGDHTLAEAGAAPRRIASPIHSGPEVSALLVAERSDRPFRDNELTLIESLTRIASLAFSHLARAAEPAAGQRPGSDPLTGLAGRSAFEARTRRAIGDSFAVISVDIDHLDQINDVVGRSAGDDALRAVARALLASTREHDFVARTSGDNFAILTVGAATAIVGSIAERVRAAVSDLVTGAFPVRVSVGWAVGAAGEDPTAVWTRADEALGRAKREGRNRVAGSITGRPAAAPGRGWTTLLSRVLASQQINPVYQPIVTLPDAHIVAYEGLARPVNLDGADSVEEFFATAQRLGVMNELDWICRRAVVRGAEGIRSDAQLYVNIDLSAVADVDEDVEQMRSLLQWIGRATEGVVLEVADADRFTNLGQLSARVDTYRRAGFRIAIDDAGRPGIGVDLLHAVRPDVIKIDSSITNRCYDIEAKEFIFECIALAEQIGAEVVAEGIERLSVAAELARMGVFRGQGFLFGKPDTVIAPNRVLDGEPALLRTLVATG